MDNVGDWDWLLDERVKSEDEVHDEWDVEDACLEAQGRSISEERIKDFLYMNRTGSQALFAREARKILEEIEALTYDQALELYKRELQ